MKMGEALTKILILALIYEGYVNWIEQKERFEGYKWARKYCDDVNKPLLRIGMRRSIFEPPNGDYTLDIDPAVENLTDTIGVLGDERAMPFLDKQFGVCFNEHTLEHLRTPEDVKRAINESIRVADYAIWLCPSPYGIYATLFCPNHRLRIWLDNDPEKIKAIPNEFRTGIGYRFEADTGGFKNL